MEEKKKKRVERPKGVIIHARSISLIEPADDDKITILTEEGIGVMDGVAANTIIGGGGVTIEIGSSVVIKTGVKKKAKRAKKMTGSFSSNIFM